MSSPSTTVVSYKGSITFTRFPLASITKQQLSSKKQIVLSLAQVPATNRGALFVPRSAAYLHVAKDHRPLLIVWQLVGRIQAARIRKAVDEIRESANSAAEPLIQHFYDTKRSLVPARSRRKIHKRNVAFEQCRKPSIAAKLVRLERLCTMTRLLTRHKMTVSSAARLMNISIGSATNLKRQIVSSRGAVICDVEAKIASQLDASVAIQMFLEQNQSNSKFLANSIAQNFTTFMSNSNASPTVSNSAFYTQLHDFGFRHRAIKYKKSVRQPLKPAHVRLFGKFYCFVLLRPDLFDLVFLDETSVCPSNFKRKQWQVRGRENVVSSRMKYEKIMLLGAMSRNELIAAQFVLSGFNAKIFCAFVQRTVQAHRQRFGAAKQLVLMLDNCSSHHDKALRAMAERTGIVFLFNMPHYCQLNPIEYLWESIKRPLRRMADYDR